MTRISRSIGSLGDCAKHLGKNFCIAAGAVKGDQAVETSSVPNWTYRNSLTETQCQETRSVDPSSPVFYPQADWEGFHGASPAKDVGVHRALVGNSERMTTTASWGGGGVFGVENIPQVNTGTVNLDVLSSNLELLRRMEESVLGIRTVVLSSKRQKLDTSEIDEENGASYPLDPQSRMRQICSKMGDLSDSLLVGLGKIGMANKELKRRLFKRTLDFGYVFREGAIQNVWHYVHDLGVSEEEILGMFDKDPLFASRSFSRNVAPKVRWLESLGLEGGLVVHKWLAKANKLLFRCSMGKLKENYSWLQNLGLSREECTNLLIKCPQILQKDLNGLNEKLLFAVAVLGKDLHDLVRWPTYFTYSFQNRILMRTAFCSVSGIDFKNLAIPTLFGTSDAQFFLRKRKQLTGPGDDNDKLMKSFSKFKKSWAELDPMEKYALLDERTKLGN